MRSYGTKDMWKESDRDQAGHVCQSNNDTVDAFCPYKGKAIAPMVKAGYLSILRRMILSGILKPVTVLAMLLAPAAFGATYYIDFSAGADANTGLNPTSAWKRHPYMLGWTGKYTHAAGDRFIFKGGVSWDYTCFPMKIAAGGTTDNPDYYGISTTWYSGSSWQRPLFDCAGSSGQKVPNGWVVVFGASWVNLDSIHFTNYFWDATVQYPYLIRTVANEYLTLTNLLFDGWYHPAVTNGGADGMCCIMGESSYPSRGVKVVNCYFDGTTGLSQHSDGRTRASGAGVYRLPCVRGCVFTNIANAINIGGSPDSETLEVSGNTIVNVYPCFDNLPPEAPNHPGGHHNCIQQVGGGAIRIFNNVIYNSYGYVISVGEVLPGGPAYIWNNLTFNNVDVSQIHLDGRYGSDRYASIYNNTLVATNGYAILAGPDTNPKYHIYATNNHFIGAGIYPKGYLSCDVANNLTQTFPQATGAGYTVGNLYKPTAGTSPTVNGGLNLSSVFQNDLLNKPRPGSGQPWDIGAYQFQSGTQTTNEFPAIPNLFQNPSDADTATAGIQVYEGTTATYSASLSAQTPSYYSWQWIYRVNGGPETVLQQGSGTVSPASYLYKAGTAASQYTWILRVGNGVNTSDAQLLVQVQSAPVVQPPILGSSFQADAGVITAPMVSSSGYVSQPAETSLSNGGRITYQFTVPSDGQYGIVAIVDAPSDGANSFYVNIDQEPTDPFTVWHIPVTSGFEKRVVSWQGNGTWDNSQFRPKFFDLTAGVHQLIIVGREANVTLQTLSIAKRPQPPAPVELIYVQNP